MDAAVEQILNRLQSGDFDARLAAARELAQTSPTPPAAAGGLAEALEAEPDDRLTPWVEAALEQLADPAVDQVDRLIQVLERFRTEGKYSEAAYWTVRLLGRMGPGAVAAVPSLTALLDRAEHPNLQANAAWALGKIGAAARSAIPHLTRIARSASPPRLIKSTETAISEIGR